MDGFKEFQGKDLDSAIQDACLYYNAEREKLEIEIVQDAKSGIFGIVGARKARIRARRSKLQDAVQDLLGELGGQKPGRKPSFASGLAEDASAEAEGSQPGSEPARTGDKVQGRRCAPKGRNARQDSQNTSAQGASSEYVPLSEEDIPEALAKAKEAIALLLSPLVETQPQMDVCFEDGLVSVTLSGLDEEIAIIIGRDGSTLTAVQYLASRLTSRRMQKSVRVSLEVGNYRQRQEEELKAMASALADKVLASGKSLSTRPLSSYQRRIVHLFLKDKEGIQTRSTGDGALKRVLILCRKARQSPRPKPSEQ